MTTPAVKMDGYENIVTGRGIVGRDKMVHGTFNKDLITDRQILEAMYTSNGIFKRIVDLIVDDSLREDLNVSRNMEEEFERLDFIGKLHELACYSRLFGGAAMLLLTKDPSGYEEPLSLTNLQKLEKLIVLNKYCISSITYDEDIESESFGDVTHYNVTMPQSSKMFKIHASRIVIMKGEWSPVQASRMMSDWGVSCLQFCHGAIKNYIHISGLIPSILDEYMLTLIKVKGLFESYASGNEAKVAKRLADANFSKSTDNIILMDGEYEDFERITGNVAGFSELVSDIMYFVSAETGIPACVLFGRSPQGMNATGESDREIWHAQVQSFRKKKLKPVINRIVELIIAQSSFTTDKEQEDDTDSSWNFKPLEVLGDAELAEVRFKNAQADAIYADNGGADMAYLFHKRHEGGYSSDLNYSLDDYQKFSENFDITFQSHMEQPEGTSPNDHKTTKVETNPPTESLSSPD